jgi:hypothetical protein
MKIVVVVGVDVFMLPHESTSAEIVQCGEPI